MTADTLLFCALMFTSDLVTKLAVLVSVHLALLLIYTYDLASSSFALSFIPFLIHYPPLIYNLMDSS